MDAKVVFSIEKHYSDCRGAGCNARVFGKGFCAGCKMRMTANRIRKAMIG